MNHKADCRTALATPGLLKINRFTSFLHPSLKGCVSLSVGLLPTGPPRLELSPGVIIPTISPAGGSPGTGSRTGTGSTPGTSAGGNITGDTYWSQSPLYCRERCMDLVSFESPGEFRHFAEILLRGGCWLAFSNFQSIGPLGRCFL